VRVFGEIYICQFPFTSGQISKPRPALVLFDLGADALIARITSVSRSRNLDIPIIDWSAAGLALPSTVRLDRLVTAEKTLLGRRLGMISARDQSAIRTAWNRHMQL
jgi:mRNA-degrading endonuclease toxin of MazEF toxin-antitoxin module